MSDTAAVGGFGAVPFTLLLFVILAILVGVTVYFIPTIVAVKKRHRQKIPILVLNIFLGWTFLGWVIALVWALIKDTTSHYPTTKTE